MPLSIGDTAPPFTLVSTDTSSVATADYKGKKLVILFFPLAFTSVCTAELCETRDKLSQFNSLNADVVAISVDSPFTLAKFKEENKLNFPLLSDFNKDTSRAYDSLYEDFVLGLKGVSKRAAFVLDESGKIIYEEVLDNAGEQPDFGKILKVLNN